MDDHQIHAARACLAAAETDARAFPQIVGALMEAGFESYAVDFRRATVTYYLPDGASLELPAHRVDAPIAPTFDPVRLQAAIRDAQQQVPDYTYRGFCETAASAGCAGYVVSFSGRRALYMGRTAEILTEPFPNS